MSVDPGVTLDPIMNTIQNENMVARNQATERALQGATSKEDMNKVFVSNLAGTTLISPL